MHMQGQPKTMQEAPKYDDVFADVARFFTEHIVRCERAGIAKEKLLLDPGFGFGKNLPIIMSCLPDSASSIISVCRCW
jgi:dihydropteroate synthase